MVFKAKVLNEEWTDIQIFEELVLKDSLQCEAEQGQAEKSLVNLHVLERLCDTNLLVLGKGSKGVGLGQESIGRDKQRVNTRVLL